MNSSAIDEFLLDEHQQLTAADAVGAAQMLRRGRGGQQVLRDRETLPRLGRLALRFVDPAEVKVAKREIGIDVNGLLKRGQRVLELVLFDPKERHKVMGPEIQRIEGERASEPVSCFRQMLTIR